MLGGGKFTNGAITSAFQHLFNNEATRPKLRINVGFDKTLKNEADRTKAFDKVFGHFIAEFERAFPDVDLIVSRTEVDLAPSRSSGYVMVPGMDADRVAEVTARLAGKNGVGVLITSVDSLHVWIAGRLGEALGTTYQGGIMVNAKTAHANVMAHELGHRARLQHHDPTPIMRSKDAGSGPLPFDDYYKDKISNLFGK